MTKSVPRAFGCVDLRPLAYADVCGCFATPLATVLGRVGFYWDLGRIRTKFRIPRLGRGWVQ